MQDLLISALNIRSISLLHDLVQAQYAKLHPPPLKKAIKHWKHKLALICMHCMAAGDMTKKKGMPPAHSSSLFKQITKGEMQSTIGVLTWIAESMSSCVQFSQPLKKGNERAMPIFPASAPSIAAPTVPDDITDDLAGCAYVSLRAVSIVRILHWFTIGTREN